MEIKLKKNTRDFLLEELKKENKILYSQLKAKEKTNLDREGSFEINEDFADIVRDWAMDKQQIIGFDEDYDLTNEGEMLQEIIDKFFTDLSR